jgi:hypothetical protein
MTSTEPASPETRTNQRLWLTFSVICGLLVINSLATVSFSPKLSRDEAEIVEYGRMMLEPQSPWCMTLTPDGKPETLLGWVSCLAHELVFRVTNHHDSPRILALLGCVAAAALAVFWLRQRGLPALPAGAVGILMLVDPIAETPVRYGRPDAWVCALAFLSAILVRHSGQAGRAALALAALGGVGAGVIPWVWVTGLILSPMVLLEWWDGRARDRASFGPRTLAAILAGMLAGFILSAIPVLGSLDAGTRALMDMMAWNAGTNASINLIYVIKDILWLVSIHPFTVMLVIAGAFQKDLRPWSLSLAAFLGIMLLTRIYDSRYYYLLPYMVPLLSEGGRRIFRDTTRGAWIMILVSFLSALLSTVQTDFRWTVLLPAATGLIVAAWSLTRARTSEELVRAAFAPAILCGLWWAVGIRDFSAAKHAQAHDYKKLVALVEKKIGRGPVKVFCPYSLYFPGRQLGWEMYRFRLKTPPAELEKLWNKCDVVVIDDDLMSDKVLDPHVLAAGFRLEETISAGASAFRFRGGEYGPYRLYRKPPLAGTAPGAQGAR